MQTHNDMFAFIPNGITPPHCTLGSDSEAALFEVEEWDMLVACQL